VTLRRSVSQPLQTGYKPSNRWCRSAAARELIIGDRQTGKTALRSRHDHQSEEHRR